MSDALCGPSNPLQQFKQQSSLDRTLQQDRLRPQQAPSHQGFRSHDPNTGLLDPEFEAFQAGGLPPPPEAFHHGPPQQPHLGQPFQQPMMGGGAPDWASDFQRMNLSGPAPPPQQQHFSPGAQGSGWAQSFQQHIAQQAPRAQPTSSPSPLAFQQRARYGPSYGGMGGFQSRFAPQQQTAGFEVGQQPGKGKEAVMEEFDDAAFERAFEQARGEIAEEEEEREQAQTGESMTGVQQVEESDLSDLQRRMGEAAQGISDPVLADDRLQKEQLENLAHVAETQGQQEEPRAEGQDDDALAATAQELLEKVEHNQTEKFRNSQFLGLMRKLRDREVKVRGEEMVETAAMPADPQTLNAPSTNSTSTGTNTATTTTPRFDNSEQRPAPFARMGSPGVQGLHGPVDSRPAEYAARDETQQDADLGRHRRPLHEIDPAQDGQAVVDLLNQPEPPREAGEEIGTSSLPEGALFDDSGVPAFGFERGTLGQEPGLGQGNVGNGENDSLTEMLYGRDGTLSAERWSTE